MTRQQCPRCGGMPQHIGVDLAGNPIYQCFRQITYLKPLYNVLKLEVGGMYTCGTGFQAKKGILHQVDQAYIASGDKVDTVRFTPAA